MLETTGNIWDHQGNYDAVVITTNSIVNAKGLAVMGRGIALAAKSKYPHLAHNLGVRLKKYGNLVYIFEEYNDSYGDYDTLITFPVKRHWKEKADVNLIKFSAVQLQVAATIMGLERVLMPRPGCGNGGLTWEEVKPAIEDILDERFTVMEKE